MTEAFDLLDWVETGTVGRREVVIYNDPALAAEMDRLRVEHDKASEAPDGERGVGEKSDVARIEAEMEAVYERWQASKAVWTVRALSQDEVQAVLDEIPSPKRPQPVKEDARKSLETRAAEQVEYEAAVEVWKNESRKVLDERNLHMISAAVESVVTPKGAASSVSVDVLRAIQKRPHGTVQLGRLIGALNELTSGEVVVEAPFSQSKRENTRR